MPRKKTKSRRRRFRGINLWNLAESGVQASILTQNWFNANPVQFVLGSSGSGSSLTYGNMGNVSGIGIGVAELFGAGGAQARATAWNNMKNTWAQVAIQSISTRAGFAVAKKLTRGMRSDVNKGFRMLGLGSEVRV